MGISVPITLAVTGVVPTYFPDIHARLEWKSGMCPRSMFWLSAVLCLYRLGLSTRGPFNMPGCLSKQLNKGLEVDGLIGENRGVLERLP